MGTKRQPGSYDAYALSTLQSDAAIETARDMEAWRARRRGAQTDLDD